MMRETETEKENSVTKSQLGRNVRGRSKSDEDRYAACAQIYCRRASVVCARIRAGISEISYFQGNARRSGDPHDIYEGEIPNVEIFPKYL